MSGYDDGVKALYSRPFREHYWAELKRNNVCSEFLKEQIKERTVTFVHAARDNERYAAVVLKEFLEKGKRSS